MIVEYEKCHKQKKDLDEGILLNTSSKYTAMASLIIHKKINIRQKIKTVQ